MKKPSSDIHKLITEKQKILASAISNKELDDVIIAFREYIDEFMKIGSYNKNTWNVTWTRTCWMFFVELSEYTYATEFLAELDRYILNGSISQIEALEFARCELRWAITENKDLIKDDIKRLVIKYPYNVEFAHTLAHVLIFGDDGEKIEAINYYRRCIIEWGSNNNELIKQAYNHEMDMFRSTLERGDYENAQIQITNIQSFDAYSKNAFFNNNSIIYNERIKDRQHTQALAKEIEKEVKESVRKEYEAQSKKNIEQLGIFSAVITFIITAAAAAFNSSSDNTPLILVSIGLILILFISTISLFNDKPRDIFKDFRLYIILLYAFLTICVISIYQTNNITLTDKKTVVNKTEQIKEVNINSQ